MSSEISLFAIFFSAFLINNIILIKFLALCSFFGVSNDIEASIGMGMAVMFVMVMATCVSWIVYYFILNSNTSIIPLILGKEFEFNLVFLRTSVFILTIASLVQFVEMILKKYYPVLYNSLGIFLPLITTNCAILAVAFLSIDLTYNFIQSIIYAIGASFGYTLVIILFAGIRRQINLSPVPASIKGYPMAFFISSLMSLAFLGFKGMFGL